MRRLSHWWQSRISSPKPAALDSPDWSQVWNRLPQLAGLSPQAAERLKELALHFLREKQLEPAQDLELTDLMRLTVACLACLPILELDLDWYHGWYSLILYPDQFVPGREVMDEQGLVWTDDEAKSGEAWDHGPVILSWADVQAGLALDGYNVVIHEMAHKLDLRDGAANGCPPLHSTMSPMTWKDALTRAYDDLSERTDAGEDTLIDPYGAESPAEFFAVVSECFFELPALLYQEYPSVYEQLELFYRQSTLARLAGI